MLDQEFGTFFDIARFHGMQYLLVLGYDLPHGVSTSFAIEKRESKPQLGNQNGVEVLQTRAIEHVKKSLMGTEVHLDDVAFLSGRDRTPQAFNYVLHIGQDRIWVGAMSLQRRQFD